MSVEPRRVRAEARRAIIDLHLPERFADYWVACFFAPYQRDGLRVILGARSNGGIRAKRAFPPPAAMWFEAGVDLSTAPATLVIEGPAALASSALLRAAERRALESKRRWGFTKQHPLTRSRQIGPALADRARARAEPNPAREKAIKRAKAWHRSGEKPGFIAHRLGQLGYQVSERTVRRWLEQADASSQN